MFVPLFLFLQPFLTMHIYQQMYESFLPSREHITTDGLQRVASSNTRWPLFIIFGLYLSSTVCEVWTPELFFIMYYKKTWSYSTLAFLKLCSVKLPFLWVQLQFRFTILDEVKDLGVWVISNYTQGRYCLAIPKNPKCCHFFVGKALRFCSRNKQRQRYCSLPILRFGIQTSWKFCSAAKSWIELLADSTRLNSLWFLRLSLMDLGQKGLWLGIGVLPCAAIMALIQQW